MRRFRLTIALLLPLFAGCNKAELVDIIKLGWTEKIISISERTSDGAAQLIANRPFNVKVEEGSEWIHLPVEGLMPSTRKEIPFRCEANQSFKRIGKIILSAGTRVDTLFIRQEGALQDRISLANKTFSVSKYGGSFRTEVECFRYTDNLNVETSVPSMVSAYIVDGWLNIKVAEAVARDPKEYTVTVFYLNGWGERTEAVLTLQQEANQ